ncbi:CmcJ/NvfI family oxidoreductase [uncultured Rhodoblastus sp.]|uniref:CmcJ/NvfI family oxidoreductase n=1 Tax=uncultured Rhodoblastus sp. TaxID=543037 RepID=UPI0025F9DA3C|nr:CmcJ/NvfI family oxidoreductase [uncultured Rhodoblastus sp.]
MSLSLLAAQAPEELETVSASLGFAERGAEKHYFFTFEPPEGVSPTNVAIGDRRVAIANARPVEERLSLNREGYAVVRRPTAVRDFWDEAQTLALGHPEAAEIVKAATGAARVVVFDHTLRRRTGVPDRSPGAPRQPVARVHVDQTVWSGPQRVREIMGEQAEDLLSRRAAIVNVWRPIRHRARDWPLALADARSIDPADLLPCEHIFRHRRGETYGLAYNPAQRWQYIPDLDIDECILFKCWDSDETVARFAPHSAFDDPTTPPGTPPRESIEFRTIAFFD